MFLDVELSYILTSTLIFDCILFATDTPITVAVTPVAVYTVVSVVPIEPDILFLNVFAIY
jgi:hypothetical protein